MTFKRNSAMHQREAARPVFPNPPKHCDTCPSDIKDVFYDMQTKKGGWAYMCPPCALDKHGIARCGEGLGQKYVRAPFSSDFRKVEG